MTSLSATFKSHLDTNWNTGSGGTEPAFEAEGLSGFIVPTNVTAVPLCRVTQAEDTTPIQFLGGTGEIKETTLYVSGTADTYANAEKARDEIMRLMSTWGYQFAWTSRRVYQAQGYATYYLIARIREKVTY
jgi:hypothetical protein